MPSLTLRLLFVFAGLCGSAVAWAADVETGSKAQIGIPETGDATNAASPVDALMRSFLTREEVPGAAITVAKGGKVLYSRGFGWADAENKTPVQPDALFRIASVSKPITAVAVFKLVEQGKLKLGDRALELLKGKAPWTPSDPRWRGITVLQLLQHTAGFDRDVSGDPMFRTAEIAKEFAAPPPAGTELIVRHMLARPLDFDPGARYAYSNFGYCLLGRVIEAVDGRPYETFVREEVLRPLGITRMRIGATRPEGRGEGEVRYYTRGNRTAPSVFTDNLGVPTPVPYGGLSLEAMDAHGGWIASAPDLVRLAAALDDDASTRVLSRESVAAMFAPPPSPISRDAKGSLTPVYYACGWSVRPMGGSGKANTFHNGLFAGTSTLLVRRHDGFTWAVLFNTDQTAGARGAPASVIDPLIHPAVDRAWPRR